MADKLKVKRERGANFSMDEIHTLISIITENKEIIECKKTDAKTWRKKDKAWDTITDSFNSSFATLRTKKALRTKYEDIKKNIRKKYAHNKTELFKNGGRVTDIEKLTSAEVIVANLMRLTVDGCTSIWDSNNVSVSQDVSRVNDDNIDDADNKDREMHNILRPFGAFESIEYPGNYGNEEEVEKITDNETNPEDGPRKGLCPLKRSTSPEIRPMKKIKRRRESAEHDYRETDQKEEMNEMRMNILRKELEINEARLVAAQLDIEIKQLEKEIKKTHLRKLLQK